METNDLGSILREWRARRNFSQLDLAHSSEISARHLSFIETGRSAPSVAVIDRLARELAMPPRVHNCLRVAGGYAPSHRERALDEPDLESARKAVEQILKGTEPYPAIAVDRHWNMVMANAAAGVLLQGVDPELLHPKPNALRIALDPRGLAPRIENFAEWRAHLLARLGQQIDATGDAGLAMLEAELRCLPNPQARTAVSPPPPRSIAVPLVLSHSIGRLSFLSTVTIFGTPVDVTLSELAIESFFPADSETAERLQALV